MKTFLILIFILTLANVQAQHLTSSVGLERTVAAVESQFAMGFENRKTWSLGAFYQTKISFKPFEMENGKRGAAWYGLYLNAPLVNANKISLYAQLRAGLKHDRFIVVVPSLETKVRVAKGIAVIVGCSFRHTYPAFLLKTNISLFNNTLHRRSQSAFN